MKDMKDELANLRCAMEGLYAKIKQLEGLLKESNKNVERKVCM
jgi:hypothetical protein